MVSIAMRAVARMVAVVVVLAIFSELGAAAPMPGLNCSFPFKKGKPCLDMSTPLCSDGMKELIPCLQYLMGTQSQGPPRPPANCCSAVQKVARDTLGCFCYVTFYPPDVVKPVLQEAMPGYCKLTTDLCSVCPALLGLAPGNSSCGAPLTPSLQERASKSAPKGIFAIVAISITGVVIAALALCIFLACRRRKKAWRCPASSQDRDDILKIEGRPTLFTYTVLKNATRNFHSGSKLGEGGFGSVFKGVLPDGTEVAVKQLSQTSRQGQEEFLNEVTLITGVQHRNLVKLRGCCLKGGERLLVYEYLENKSLNQALFDAGQGLHLDWPTRVKILVGTARGLAYLHEGCQTRIIHRDIKASNILLDKDLNPKIADFGLARFFLDDQSHISTRVAGTVGYLAPEYAMRGQLTEKADVFSFGIVALELVSGRGNLDLRLPTDMAYLLDWTWQLHEDQKLEKLLDPTLKGPISEEEVLRVIDVALLCTQSVATMRPTMSRVVTMLAGEAEIDMPEISKPRIRHYAGRGGTSTSSSPFSKDYSQGSTYNSGSSLTNTASYMSTVEPR